MKGTSTLTKGLNSVWKDKTKEKISPLALALQSPSHQPQTPGSSPKCNLKSYKQPFCHHMYGFEPGGGTESGVEHVDELLVLSKPRSEQTYKQWK